MQADSDGIADFGFVEVFDTSLIGPPWVYFRLHTLRGLGNGQFRYQPPSVALPALHPVTTLANPNFEVDDVNGDGVSDLVQLVSYHSPSATGTSSNYLKNGVYTIVNEHGKGERLRFAQTAQPESTLERWIHMDVDADGILDFVEIPADGSGAIHMLMSRPSRELLASQSNGLGAIESVTYVSSAGTHLRVPLGTHLTTVSKVTLADQVRGGVYSTDFRYDGLVYSYGERRLLGFSTFDKQDSNAIIRQIFNLSDGCGQRVAATKTMSPVGALISQRSSLFAKIAATPPFRCEPARHIQYECEGSVPCLSATTDLEYDDYGNLAWTHEYGDPYDIFDDRESMLGYHYNNAQYIVGLPAFKTVSGVNSSTGILEPLSSVLHVYDSQVDYTKPPLVGNLTRDDVWDNEAGVYVATSFEYDAFGNRIKVTDPVGIWTSSVFDCNYHQFEVSTANDLFPVLTQRSWDFSRGLLRSQTDVNLAVKTFSYDELGRVTEVLNPDGSFARTEYVDFGTPEQRVVSRISDTSADGAYTEEVYFDGLNRTWMKRYENAGEVPSMPRSREFQYSDATANPSSESSVWTASETSFWTQFSYDPLKRRTKVLLPDQSSVATNYFQGFHTKVDQLGQKTDTYTDPFRRTVKIREYHRSCSAVEVCSKTETYDTTYSYDALDRVTSTVDSLGHASSVVWNSLGQKRQVCDPDSGCSEFIYYPNGQVWTKTDALGQQIEFLYDVIGRPAIDLHRDVDGKQTRTITTTHDSIGGVRQGMSLGRRVHVFDSQSGGNLSWNGSYDSMGRVVSETTCILGKCLSFAEEFDVGGRASSTTYPDGERVAYEYDSADQLDAVPSYADRLVYRSDGQIDSISFSNGVTQNYKYEPQRRWITGQGLKGPAGTLFSATYSHDLTAKVTFQSLVNPSSVDLRFTYDDLNRLTSATSSAAPNLDQSFEYDQIGNITYNSMVGSYLYTDPRHVHAVTETSGPLSSEYSYDAIGNLLDGRGLHIRWDSDGRPVELSNASSGATVEYVYNDAGQRVAKRSAGGWVRYFGQYAELSAKDELTKYYYAGTRRIAKSGPNGVNFYHQDYLGSTRVVTDSRGKVVSRFNYAPFGSATHGNRFGFTDQESDDESDLIYMDSRYYDPVIARFVSADTIVPSGSPQTLNRYSYVMNSPLNYVDPSGHSAVPLVDAAFIALDVYNIVNDVWSGNYDHVYMDVTMLALDVSYAAVPGPPGLNLSWHSGNGLARLAHVDHGVQFMHAGTREAAQAARAVETQAAQGGQKLLSANAGPTAHISPSEVAGKTPAQIDARARELGLQPRGPDPAGGRGAYVDPQTGQQRILSHPNASAPHGHVNKPAGQRIGPNGEVVLPESPAAHLPIKIP
jgi:RHS repeat-associated protein